MGLHSRTFFLDFDPTPLGSASIAQVHKATLLDGRVVAVKLQRPNVEPKLRGDIANLKRKARPFENHCPSTIMPSFVNWGRPWKGNWIFGQKHSHEKLHFAISRCQDGKGKIRVINDGDNNPCVTIPLPVGESVTKRVLVMDFIPGVPLNRLAETTQEKGILPGSMESKLAGRRILDCLAVFGRKIFDEGFLHGDPHPGR